MSLRKIAGLLAAGGLTVGLIGGGVGAQFFDSVTAQEKIQVGTFECKIVAPSDGIIAPNGKSVTYTAPTIMSSAAGSAPFSFTVQNTGSIPDMLTVSVSSVGAPFSIIGAPFDPVPLGAGGTHTYNTGVAWGALTNANLGASGTVTWTVDCGDVAGAVIFDNTPSVLPANLPSVGPEAYSYNEFGAQVQFAGTARKLTTATVTMSSWACQSGSWNLGTCLTTPGATFDVPITFNVYDVGPANAVGSLVATKTQTFTIPYRPSADATNCTAGNAGKWFDGTGCFNGKAVNITFTFPGQTLPDKAIFGITFNTDNHGYSPLGGSGSPTDSLNVAMYPGTGNGSVATTPSAGAFLPDGLSAYLNSTYGPFYLDGGASGTGTFRLDTGTTTSTSIGAYGGYEPAVQITAVN